jgi:hypothetical protein
MSDCKVINLDSRRRRAHSDNAPASLSALMADGVADLGAPALPRQDATVYVLDDLRRPVAPDPVPPPGRR